MVLRGKILPRMGMGRIAGIGVVREAHEIAKIVIHSGQKIFHVGELANALIQASGHFKCIAIRTGKVGDPMERLLQCFIIAGKVNVVPQITCVQPLVQAQIEQMNPRAIRNRVVR